VGGRDLNGVGCSKWKRYVLRGDRRRRGSQATSYIFGGEREEAHRGKADNDMAALQPRGRR
jgi:hypothetical protein